MGVSEAGYYYWRKNPVSRRMFEDRRLLRLIRDSYEASGRVYGSPRISLDLREMGEVVNKSSPRTASSAASLSSSRIALG